MRSSPSSPRIPQRSGRYWEGIGKIRIEGDEKEVSPGDGIAILPGKRHKVWNTAKSDLVFLCCCSPAYSHDDTVMVE